MNDPLVPNGDGHTALSEDDRRGLLLTYVVTREDLFDAEQRNISKALLRRRPTVDRLLDDHYLRRLHRDMFGQVWSWAGRYRLHETNLGIDPREIPMAVRSLVGDCRAWLEHSSYLPDEVAVRFHHRLVAIHPFPNGNGRHGRVAADQLIAALGQPPFTWGRSLRVATAELRGSYRHALVAADDGDIAPLLEFARR